MTKEQMHKEVARLNNKIEIELTEIKNLANWLLAKADDADSITFHCPSRMIAQSEKHAQGTYRPPRHPQRNPRR